MSFPINSFNNATVTLTVTGAGAASSPPFLLTGALFTGGTGTTTVPLFYFNNGAIAPADFSTAGTYWGVNPPNGFTGNFFDFKYNNGTTAAFVAKLSYLGLLTLNGSSSGISSTGSISTAGSLLAGATGGIGFTGSTLFKAPSNGVFTLYNSALSGFTRLQLGGTTASFPAIRVNGAALNFRLADDSADAAITASTITASGTMTMTGMVTAVAVKTAAYTATATDFALYGDGTSSAFNFTLPAAAANLGRAYEFAKIDSTSNAIGVAPAGADTIDFSAAVRYMSTQGATLKMRAYQNGATYGWKLL